nr:immunoglobulin light chain junction region [Macaca mulatta]MOY15152.1 immunoglobulin light chain junction region [Macaca mulatta]
DYFCCSYTTRSTFLF